MTEHQQEGWEEGFEAIWHRTVAPNKLHIKRFIAQEIQKARTDALREAGEVVKKSRTLEEALGVGIREESARAQATADLATLDELSALNKEQ